MKFEKYYVFVWIVIALCCVACDNEETAPPFQESECVDNEVFFDRGPIIFSAYTVLIGEDGELNLEEYVLEEQVEYEYDETGKLTNAIVKLWEPFEDHQLYLEKKRVYTYDDFDRLEIINIENDIPADLESELNPDTLAQDHYYYDDQDRLIKWERYSVFDDGTLDLQSSRDYEYGENGRVFRDSSSEYEYDNDGRLVRRYPLQWNQINPDIYTDYTYDGRGRLSDMVTHQYLSEWDEWYVPYETEYEYNADTFDLIGSPTARRYPQDDGYNSFIGATVYEREDSTLTITYDDGNAGHDNYRYIIEFSDEGTSNTWSNSGPTPPNMWATYYGTTYINGCVDL